MPSSHKSAGKRLGRTGIPSHKTCARGPALDTTEAAQWRRGARISDRLFRSAMQAAIGRGLEHCLTSPSTSLGTRCPVSNYQRGDL